MDKLIIAGGCRLSGEIEASGAKNSTLPILVSSLLSPNPCFIDNVPHVVDVKTMCTLLGVFGAEISPLIVHFPELNLSRFLSKALPAI